MSEYISKSKPIYKDWQFESLKEGIDEKDWLTVVDGMENIERVDNSNRYKLHSIQNPEFCIHIRHNPKKGNALTFSGFPDRFIGEFIKHIKDICDSLNATYYSLNNNGVQEEFDFSQHAEKINKNYFPVNEKKITNIEVSEMLGLVTIPTHDVKSVISMFNLSEKENIDWEQAVSKCYKASSIMIRSVKDWIIVVGKPEYLVKKMKNKLGNIGDEKEQLFELLKILSEKYGRVGYNFNASKYSYFENFKAENGQIVYKYVHEDGEEEILGETNKEYFDDFMTLCYDQTILDGVKLYE